MSQEALLKEFKSLLHQKEVMTGAQKIEREALEQEWKDTQADLWKHLAGKRKFPGGILACQEFPDIADAYLAFQERARVLLRQQDRASAVLEGKIGAMAKELDVPVTEEPILMDTVSSSTYNSQGFGACKYAQQAAEAQADKARMYGLNPEVRTVSPRDHVDQFHNTIHHAEYEIWVHTSEAGLEILKRKPEQSMKEWVKACAQRGVNPKVYSPMLADSTIKEALGS